MGVRENVGLIMFIRKVGVDFAFFNSRNEGWGIDNETIGLPSDSAPSSRFKPFISVQNGEDVRRQAILKM